MPTADQIAQSQQTMNALAYGPQVARNPNAPTGSYTGSNAPAYAGDTGLSSGDLLRRFSMADFQADPGYAFRQQQGQQQIERGAAARAGLLSGAAIKAGQRFGQDLASQEYQNAYNRFNNDQTTRFNRLAAISGVGQNAANTLGQAGQNYASNVGNLTTQNAATQGNAALAAGNARASGYLGVGNALASGFANWPQQQQQQQPYQIPQGYQLGSGSLGNAAATSQGYQPLDYSTYNNAVIDYQ